jgi:hypothetical protein
MGTNWFMPALVKRRLGESGIKLEEGTMVCCFDLKKSRNDWRISVLVMFLIVKTVKSVRSQFSRREGIVCYRKQRGD